MWFIIIIGILWVLGAIIKSIFNGLVDVADGVMSFVSGAITFIINTIPFWAGAFLSYYWLSQHFPKTWILLLVAIGMGLLGCFSERTESFVFTILVMTVANWVLVNKFEVYFLSYFIIKIVVTYFLFYIINHVIWERTALDFKVFRTKDSFGDILIFIILGFLWLIS